MTQLTHIFRRIEEGDARAAEAWRFLFARASQNISGRFMKRGDFGEQPSFTKDAHGACGVADGDRDGGNGCGSPFGLHHAVAANDEGATRQSALLRPDPA